ncbi:MAG: amidase [Anaerolineales bacterium]|nr:amidase [Anaerolineales bacterium]MCB0012182.1 amidase [Anaerolineales bacterium]MCB0026664.1 amidase [Anaerolineales bacterium]
MSLELCYLSAQEALALFRSRQLSPVELMQAVIARAEQVEPHLNAFTYTYYEEALAAAREAEKRYRDGSARALEGIPTTIKDESHIAGLPTSNGSRLMQDFVAEHTTPVVERLLAAGAIVHARTATPEFSVCGVTWSDLWGVTRNPWNLAITPGGSTGGSSAALAAGSTILSNGSDIGGSIRIPAAMCGLIGFKAPYGRNPEDVPWNLEYFNHPGGLARTVGDSILLQNVISGPHPHDIASLKPKITLPDTYDNIEGWRIAYSLDLGYNPIAPDVVRNTLATLDRFRQLGATVEEVQLNWTEAVRDAYMHHLGYGSLGVFMQEYGTPEKRPLLTSYARYFLEFSEQVTREQALAAELMAAQMYSDMSQLFANYDLFICPTIGSTAVPADLDFSTDTVNIAGREVNGKSGWFLTYPFNILSRCPVMALPSGLADNGVPTSIQLVGPTFEDAVVYQAAAAYEAAYGPMVSYDHHPSLP